MSAISDLTEAWEGHSGLEVETFLKGQLGLVISSAGGKFGDAELVGSTLIFYDRPGGAVLSTVTLSGDIYTISVDCNLDQVFYVLSDETTKIMTITPSTTVSPFGSSTSQPFPEGYDYSVAVNNGSGYVNRISGQIATGESASFDIRPYLSTGDNYIRITITGDTSGQVRTSVFTGTLTMLTLSVAHTWQTPWMEGAPYVINGIRFSGSLIKVLHCSVNGVEQDPVSYTASQSYTTTATTYTIPAASFPSSGGSDVFEIKLWMTAQGVSTPEFKFNIMCVATGDTTPLVAINDIVPTMFNWTSGKLFSYAVYGADKSVFGLDASLGSETYQIVSGVTATGLESGVQYDFNYSVEVDTGVNDVTIGVLTATGTAFNGLEEGDSSIATTVFDNTYSYLPTPGALFYMNASTRNNNETSRELIINEMGASSDGNFAAYYNGTWTGFSWYGDAWGLDPEGHNALSIPAGCVLTIPELSPLGLLSAYPDGMTIELMIRNQYPANYDEPVLTIASTGESPSGLFIYPTKIIVLGSYERSVVNQTVNISENQITHITVTFVKNYEGIDGRNLVSVYINGISNVNFSFDASSIFGNNPLVVGQPDTDVYLYKMRVYGTAIDSQGVFNNFINSIIDGVEFVRHEEAEKNNLLEGEYVNYEKVKVAGFNTMVVTMTDDYTPIPSVDHPAPSDGYPNCSLRFEYADDYRKNVTIRNVSIDGQGTTSKKYYRWNLRAKTKNGTSWEYGDGTVDTGKKGRVINDPSYIKVDRITAKKNYASSMQGHKMGMTGLYNDLFKECGFGGHLPSSAYRVAVYQFPFVGFRYYESNDTYEFIGIYTAGPDKGSKVTFGYSDSYMSLLSIEGPNHAPRGTRFLHPWTDITYDPEQETLCYGGEEGWDCDYVNYESGPDGTQADWDAIRNLYETEWRPAYECVYNNSPYIASVAEVIAAINNPSISTLSDLLDPENVELITGVTIPGYLVPLGVMEFYDTEYERYFFRTKTGQYEKIYGVDSTLEHNLLEDLSGYLTTDTPTTQQIIDARIARFKANVSAYWDVEETLFHYCFCELFAVSDNFAKNSYPFKFLPYTQSGAHDCWGWRQDDMDTVLMTDNNGNNTKSYSVEPGDTSDGVQIFQGYNSALWVLIHDNYQDEIRSMMLNIVNAASALAITYGVSGDGLHGSLFNLTAYYCWDHSAKYFSETLYEKDRRWSYIQPWLENPSKEYNSVLPLTQALGDQFQAERLWMERRIPYIFSKYRIGAFNGATEGYNELAFTLANQFTFHLTPAIDLYPTAATGSTTVSGGRTMAGDSAELTLMTTGDTTNYIKGGDWLASLGDLSGMQLTARGGGDITFSIICARLLDLVIGSEDPDAVLFNANTLSVTTPSITEIDARNTTTLTNLVNLMSCPRLRKVLFAGSGATGMLLAVGAKVTEVSFPAASRTLFLHSLPYLENDKLTLPNLEGISSAMIYNCDTLDAMSVLRDITLADNNSLSYVTAVWRTPLNNDSRVFYTLASLLGLDGYVIYENGSVQNKLGTPNVSGVIDITQTLYRALIPPQLTISSDEPYGESYRKMEISNFGTDLSVIYDPLRMYPDPFVDDGYLWCYYNVTTTESETQLLYESASANQFGANFIIDGVEVPKSYRYTFTTTGEHLVKMQRSAGTLSARTFQRIYTLVRVYLPTGVNPGSYCFNTCSNLTHCWLPLSTTSISDECFGSCSKLDNLNLYLPNCTYLGTRSVYNTGALRNSAVYMPKLMSTSTAPFARSYIVALDNLGSIVQIGSSSQAQNWGTGCTALKRVVLPPTVYFIYAEQFKDCTALADVNLDNPNITRLAWGTFEGCTSLRVELNLPNLVYMNNRNFHNSRITKVRSLGRVRRFYSETNNTGCFQSDTALTEVTLPFTTTELGNMCFDGCTALKTITCYALVPPTVGSNAFRNVTPNKIYVPFDSVVAYRSATGWSAFAPKIEPIPNSQSPLPDGYKLLTFVTTDSNAWIDTGVAGATDLEIGITAMWTIYVQGGALYGNYIDDLHNANRVILDSSTSFDVAGGANLNNSISRNEVNVVNVLIVNATHNILNGFKRAIVPSTTLENTDNICLGNRSATDPVEANIGQAIYDFWIKKEGVEILHYYPCERLSDNKRGFYDLVNNVFKPSDTEVDFT